MGVDQNTITPKEIIQLLQYEFPTLKEQLIITESPDGTRIQFPHGMGADYIFQVWINPEPPPMDLEISAQIPSMQEHMFFWGHSFESAEFNSSDEMLKEFRALLHKLVDHDTRIIQRRGLLFWSYRCEVNIDSNWLPLPEVVSLFSWSNINVPSPDIKIEVYQNSKLINTNSTYKSK